MGDVLPLRGKHRRPMPMPTLMLTGFAPSEALADWAQAVFIRQRGPLHNPDHEHLQAATIGFAWAAEENSRNGRRILGQAELMPPMAMGKWQRARAIEQMTDWFGALPDFLITLDVATATLDDASFCAVVEHELYHCAQAKDAMGYPKFHRDSGDPIWAIRGHDVEEFVGVVARYGTEATGTREMVEAARGKPTVALASIATACGTCPARRAA